MKKRSSIKVLVFPKDTNPYQELLYSSLARKITIKYLYNSPPSIFTKIFILPLLISKLLFYKFNRYSIIHIHWLYPFSMPNWIPFSKQISYFYSVIFLWTIKLLNFKVVWTVHNVLPHDSITSNDLSIRKKLSSIASCKIVHSNQSVLDMKALGLNTNNAFLIRMGNYANIYPNKISKRESRNELKIDNNTFVILFFGAIRKGKGIENLVKAYIKLDFPNSKLLIVGKSSSDKLNRQINDISRHKDIMFIDKYIPNSEVAKYIKSCDVFCAPFTQNTTTSSVMLAMSMHRTVIAPRLGSLNDLPSSTGFYYNNNDPHGLAKALTYSYKNKKLINLKSTNALNYVSTLDWKTSAMQTHELYANLMNIKI